MGVLGKLASAGLKAKRADNVINIGLEDPKGGVLDPQVAKEALRAQGLEVVEYEIKGSATEPTLVAVLDKPMTTQQVHNLSVELGQEAIGARFGETGVLEGPKKADWGGEFNPEYFLEPDFNNTRRDTPLGALAERYPEVGEPVLKTDKKTGKTFLSKGVSSEGAELAKARKAARQSMADEGFEDFFPQSERYYADPTAYGERLDTSSVLPKKQATIDKHRAALEAGGARGVLQDAYKAAEGTEAEDWYAVGQLQDASREVLGREAGDEAFKTNFADAMAATTGGADPTNNLLMAQYANVMRNTGQTLPQTSYELPAPIGGRYASGNLANYEKTINQGQGLGLDNPKRYNFSRNFQGDLQGPTIDEQMTAGMTGGKLKAPPKGQYGIYEDIIGEEAAAAGVPPAKFQDVAWAGLKGTEGKPMIEHVNEAVERTHRVTGMPRSEIAERGVVKGEIPLYATGAAAMGGLLATPEENEAMAAGFKGPALNLLKKAQNIKGRVARGDITPEDGQRLLIGDDQNPGVMGTLNKMNARRINPNVRAQLADELYGIYGDIGQQTPRGGGDVRGQLFEGDVAEAALPQLADRPYTPEEEAGYNQFRQLERDMGEKPYAPSLAAQGQHVNDPFTRFQPQPAVESTYLGLNTPAQVGANNPKIVYTGTPPGAHPPGSSGIPAPTPAEIAARPTGVAPPTKPLSAPGKQTYYNPETGNYDLPSNAGRSSPVRAVGPAAGIGLGAMAYDEASAAPGVTSEDGRVTGPRNLVGGPLWAEDNGALDVLGRGAIGVGQFAMDAIHGLAAKTSAGLYGVGQMAGGVLDGDPKDLGTIANEMGALEQNIMDIDRPWIGESGEANYEEVLKKALSNPNILQALEWIGAAPGRAGAAVADTPVGHYNPELPAVVEGVLGTFTEIL